MTDRERIIRALRDVAAGHPTGRIWGRLHSATPGQAQEGNAWAADVEDVADLVLTALDRTKRRKKPMLDLVCYLIAVVLLGMAALLPVMPYRHQVAYAGLCAALIPTFVHAVQNH